MKFLKWSFLIGIFMINSIFAKSIYYGPDLKRIHAVRLKHNIKNSHKVIVAVIDTGIDKNHPLLKNHLWHDPQKYNRYGWDFVNNKENPQDMVGHGTHVSGIIAGDLDPVHHLGGVSDQVEMMELRYYSEDNPGTVNLKNTVSSIYWAVNHGARIINYSSGGPSFEKTEYDALNYASHHGVLVVVAAGNEHNDLDSHDISYYPASYSLKNLIVVAALSKKDSLIESSNWGKHTVDIAAPGENILSDLPHQNIGFLTGTSQATAFVSGAAATLLAIRPHLTPNQLKNILINTVHKIPALKFKVRSGGMLNMKKAVFALKKIKA